MAVSNNSNQHYKMLKNKIFTATKEELTLMLYEGALKFCNQAIIAIENKKINDANNKIVKAQNVIRELQITLNKEYEIAIEFDRMYNYIYTRLIDANIKKDINILNEVSYIIREFRDTWKEAITIAKKYPNNK